MRGPLLVLIGLGGLGSAASAPLAAAAEPLEQQLRIARADQARSEAEARRLEALAGRARGEAARVEAERAAAAQALDASEARISSAEAQLRLDTARMALFKRRLAAEQRPVSALLAGLVAMGRRPPIVALADRGGVEELVRMRILIDSTMPEIRRRSEVLRRRIAAGAQLQQAAASARAGLIASRQDLFQRQRRFAALEARANEAALAAGSAALSAGDVALAGREALERMEGDSAARRARQALSAELAVQPPIALGPSQGGLRLVPFAYRLPVAARVTRGVGEVDSSGIRSRGVRFDSGRGAEVLVPASGMIRFVGPFREHDGVVIIDHGGGWLSLLINVGTDLRPGTRVGMGQKLGRALGPIEAELSRNGQYLSPAIIAGSSAALSKGDKSG